MGKKPLSPSFGFWLACFSFGASLIANAASADNTDVVVQAASSAITVTRAARMSPVHLVSLSERVSYRDINFNSPTADAQLQKRIRDAAVNACQKLDERFPDSKPSGQACVALAVKDALRRVHDEEMIAQRKASN
jgi:UrcA family protein